MEIKLRRKGEVITVDGFEFHNIPATITPAEGLDGIDLTAYSVIYASFGRQGHEKAKELRVRAPSTIIVYKYEWRNGWGCGIILPDCFNPSRVRFYKSTAQEKVEAEEAKRVVAETLHKEVTENIPGVCVRVGYNHDGVVITPEQETYADWCVCAKTFKEAEAGVEKMQPLWNEWNDRVLEIFSRRGFQNPGNGNIQVVFRPNDQVAVGFYQKNGRGFYEKGWIDLEKKNGEWVESN
mgnify:CR=1 FL=1